VYCGDLFAPLPPGLRGRIDVLTANVPYVPTGQIALMPPEAREHEPRVSVDGGMDGFDTMRRVIAQASGWLKPEGHLLMETSDEQADAAANIVAAGGLTPDLHRCETLDATAILGVRPRNATASNLRG
jgi:release factor glutamine methyltransferase